MQLTGQQVFDATQVLWRIMNEKRALPQKGAYRVARMHSKLAPEFDLLNAQRTAMIIAYGYKRPMLRGVRLTEAELEGLKDHADGGEVFMQDAVPDDKMEEFSAKWDELAKMELKIEVQPIPIDQLSLGDDQEGSISIEEFKILGDLVEG